MQIIKMEDLHPLFKELRLGGMYKRLVDLESSTEASSMSHIEWIYEICRGESIERQSRKLGRKIAAINDKFPEARVENIDWEAPRRLDFGKLRRLISCAWVRCQQNIVFTGATGCGKTWLACALAHEACRQGFTVGYIHVPTVLTNFALWEHQRVGQSVEKAIEYARKDVLIVDDWGKGQLTATARAWFDRIFEREPARGGMVFTAQVPIKYWAAFIGDSTFSDSMLDKVISKAHRINIDGESMRRLEKYGAV